MIIANFNPTKCVLNHRHPESAQPGWRPVHDIPINYTA